MGALHGGVVGEQLLVTAPPAVTPGLVSVVVPTRDRAALLGDTLQALSDQSYQALEIIVVDDGSMDETPGVIQAAAERDPRIRGIRRPVSGGAAAARNAGAEMARGEFLLFEDDDCRGVPSRLERLVSALTHRPEAAYAYCRMRVVSDDGGEAVRGTLGPWSVGTPYALVRAAAFRASGGFDEALPRLQDFDLWTRLLGEHPAVEVPSVLFETVRDGSGISSDPERLASAGRLILDKYRESTLPRGHLARMHRYLAGALVVNGIRGDGLAHYRRSLHLRPWSVRSWLGVVLALLGPSAYRAAARLQAFAAAPAPGGDGRAR